MCSSDLNTKSYKDYGYANVSTTYKYYSNTSQSIYANIKDGMRILRDKLNVFASISTSTTATTTPNGTSTTYTASDRRTILATQSYNGLCKPYVQNIANTLDSIDSFFPGVTTSSISSLVQKMHIVGQNDICFKLHSPGDVSIQDAEGRTLGVVNGVVKNDFSLGSYDPATKFGFVFLPPDKNFMYKVVGTGTGVYGLDITIVSGTQEIAFQTRNMSLAPGQIDTYTIDQAAILDNQKGVTLKVDSKGDGTINNIEIFGATVENIKPEKSPPTTTASLQDIGLPNPFVIPTPIIYPPSPSPKVNITPIIPTSTLNVNTTTITSK